ncbi:thiamine pyrophosphate-dependent acetolactate synthase large subunit-like protein [Amycolatopsis sulphurea]|uniref:Thiamine pyrophosphate-dependent acetolactate synthase large subunit-like protein n=2 Tax=Amycolatopsis sulphurea TaxID=76022 RepID=A0A2A9FIR9_9PSEU|nr:thiamine pyrophosphate-dependent acetolactate synthase large subunit-like protein [Amycolatopsis sulphurea]
MLFQDAMSAALAEHGIDTIFGLVGDGNLFVMDSFRRLPGTTYVGVANEASAVEAASGYANVTGRLGVATVTHGPALTNTVTPLVDAVKARLPLLLLAGDTRPDDHLHAQNVPQREVVAAAGAGFEPIRAPSTAAVDLATAIQRAYAELRPIVVNMPAHFQWSETEYLRAPSRLVDGKGVRPADDAVEAALGVIADANRPLVLAGRGAIDPAARAAVLRFAARIGAPVGTTLKALDLFRGEQHNLGIVGTLAHEVAQSTVAAADCVIAFGASLNRYTTVNGSLAEKRRVVQVDDDRRSLGRYVAPDAGVLGDAAWTADAFVRLLDEAEIKATRFASPELAAELARPIEAPDRSDGGYIDIRTALRRVEETVAADRTVVTDSGRFVYHAWPAISVQNPRHFVHTANYGSIGLGMGTAIGAAVGRPDHPTLLVTGDGGFMLGGLNEFSTAVRHRLDLIVVLLNDGSFGAEHIQLLRRDLDPGLSLFDWPDFGPVAEALGGRGHTVRTPAELDAALHRLPDRDRPVLIDVHIDPNQVS